MQSIIYCTTLKAATTTCSNTLQEKKILRKFLVKSLRNELYLKMFSDLQAFLMLNYLLLTVDETKPEHQIPALEIHPCC